ncbi:MAG: hypothetical protein IPK16_14850 [Anaerolineales bacterium]|nr:hypothetical protein [Anaerolineales bacterium]
MSSYDADTLYSLLPAIFRIRDAEQGGALKALVSVLAEQAEVVAENLDQLYDDQFIETCAPWVTSYIGDLIGHQPLHAVAPQIGSPRAEVANTIAYRRRKGTAAVLEQLARDVTGWDARVIEFFQLLATTQYMNHLRPGNLATPDLRNRTELRLLATPFTTTTRTLEVRRIEPTRGKYNIPNVGVFLWRLGAYSLTRSPAVPFAGDPIRYHFHPAGIDSPLFRFPEAEAEITHLATPRNVPTPLDPHLLAGALRDDYGAGKSLLIETAAVDGGKLDPAQPVTAIAVKDIEVCDLRDLLDAAGDVVVDGQGNALWSNTPAPAGKVRADPVLGRLAFDADPGRMVLVTFRYGFSAAMGGGEYERAANFELALPTQKVTMPQTIGGALLAVIATGDDGAVEVGDTGRYPETLSTQLGAGQRVELRGGNENRPTLELSGEWVVDGLEQSELTLDGLLVIGGPLRVTGKLRRLHIRHCTFVPGSARDQTDEVLPSIIVETPDTALVIEQSIVGALRVIGDAETTVRSCIVDAGAMDAIAYTGPGAEAVGGALTLEETTVIGQVRAGRLPLASNTLFLARRAPADPPESAPVFVVRRQQGCVRFSYVPLGSQTPQRHRCQPATPEDDVRVKPQFTSLRYGDPGYGQLSHRTPMEIRGGASDEAEMGAFHDLFQPQRETNLRVRLAEYLRFGLEAGIFYVS